MGDNSIKETSQPQTTGSSDDKSVKKEGEFAGRKISIWKKIANLFIIYFNWLFNKLAKKSVPETSLSKRKTEVVTNPDLEAQLEQEINEILQSETLDSDKLIENIDKFKTMSEEARNRLLEKLDREKFLLAMAKCMDASRLFELFNCVPDQLYASILSEILSLDDAIKTSFIGDSENLVNILTKLNSTDLQEMPTKLKFDDLNALFEAGKDELLTLLSAKSLVDVLLGFTCDHLSLDLKTLLTNGENGVLKFISKSPDQSGKVLLKLKSADLYEVLVAGKDELLNLLSGECLANVLTKLESDKLKTLLTDKGSVVLAFLLKNSGQLYKILVELNANDLNALRKEKENGVLKSLDITRLDRMFV
jgi:hypothetical protein